jgi:hypothetical protein
MTRRWYLGLIDIGLSRNRTGFDVLQARGISDGAVMTEVQGLDGCNRKNQMLGRKSMLQGFRRMCNFPPKTNHKILGDGSSNAQRR